MCKNAKTLDFYRFRSYVEELTEGPNPGTMNLEIGDEDSLLEWYLLMRSCDYFEKTVGRVANDKEKDVAVI